MTGMKEAREAAGISQSELARRMVEAGFSTWSQTMISRRGNNELSLRWHEGVALRGIIGYPDIAGDTASDAITIANAQAFLRISWLVDERRREAVTS